MSHYVVAFQTFDETQPPAPGRSLPSLNGLKADTLAGAIDEAQKALDAGLASEATLYVQVRVMRSRP